MIETALWQFLADGLGQGQKLALLVVVASQGSSPGRQGFKMAVAADGSMAGSIGGGIMEHKLVEWSLDRLRRGIPFWELRRQIHSKDAPHDQSGMICSGEQTIALLQLAPLHLPTVEKIMRALQTDQPTTLQITNDGEFEVEAGYAPASLATHDRQAWRYTEAIGRRAIAHVIGAGHVGLAMCQVLAALGFWVINYDDRHDLNTMQANAFAQEKIVTPYPELSALIPEGDNAYVIVMTFGYRGDDEAVRSLLGKRFAYFGMMGSQSKVDKLIADLRRDGYHDEAIQQLRTPAGLVKHCKSPMEIAVSIAAEIIQIRNQS